MPFSKYRGYTLRDKVFAGFLVISLLSIFASSALSYFVLKDSAKVQSRTDLQKKSDALLSALDYAVSHKQVSTADLPKVLSNSIFEIADINNQDIILYDLQGNYLLSNKDPHLVAEKKLPTSVLQQVLRSARRLDFQTYNEKLDANVTSSYMLLKNNILEPIAVVYFPYYHNDSYYFEVFNNYLNSIVLINLGIIALSIYISWVISRNLTSAITKFSTMVNRITLFEEDTKPIRYYQNDELNQLVKAYNRMLLQIKDQKERLTFREKEEAWREMAKQVAHEVKNPLTPMKLTIQNFERKFNPEDPDIREKVKQISKSIVDQIDLVATVATAFSQFAQLPEKNNERFALHEELQNIINVFSADNIKYKATADELTINMDKIYLSRIITNLISNAQQATADERKNDIIVNAERQQKNLKITISDTGIGIPADLQDRIFEPSFTSKSSGTGLGLTMVRKMVEDYKGEISVISTPGEGSTFKIILPVIAV